MHPLWARTRAESKYIYRQVIKDDDVEQQRNLCREDLFYLLTVACRRRDIDCDWLYARCRDVEERPDGMLDLWAREHYKSTIITFGKSIQDILCNPNVTIGIFSHTKSISRAFLKQIKMELEDNKYLQNLFPEVLYDNPKKDAPTWSVDTGLVVKRSQNPKEATIEAHGLTDGMPTGSHFSLRVYDDVVTDKSVNTPDQIKKTTEAWELSDNLGAHGGKVRYIGTRYHFNDTWHTILSRKVATPRIFPATENGEADGKPVFLSAKVLAEKRIIQGPYNFGCQMLQNPVADSAMGFTTDWLRYVTVNKPERTWNFYLLCDPAGSKGKKSDYTVMAVIGLAPDGNYYLVDGLRDRVNLTERTNKLFEFHMRWHPIATGYEKYGKDSDIEHIEYEQEQRNYRFEVTALGGAMNKNERIRRLVPKFEQARFWFPRRLLFIDAEGKMRDFIQELLDDEYSAFPVAVHDDMMDCLSRIDDIGATFPQRQISSGIPGLPVAAVTAKNEYDVLG